MERRAFITGLLCTTALATVGLPAKSEISTLTVHKWKPVYRYWVPLDTLGDGFTVVWEDSPQ